MYTLNRIIIISQLLLILIPFNGYTQSQYTGDSIVMPACKYKYKGIRYLEKAINISYEDKEKQQHYEKIATRYFKKAYEYKDYGSEAYLGMNYFFGIGIGQDQQKGIKLLKEASENGHQEVNDLLGFCCYYGIGTEQDANQAIHYWTENGMGHNENTGSFFRFYNYNRKKGPLRNTDTCAPGRLIAKPIADSVLHFIAEIDKKWDYEHYNTLEIITDSLGNDWINYIVEWEYPDIKNNRYKYINNNGIICYVCGDNILKYFEYDNSSDTIPIKHGKQNYIIRSKMGENYSIPSYGGGCFEPAYDCGAVILLLNNRYYVVDNKHWSPIINYLDVHTHYAGDCIKDWRYDTKTFWFMEQYK